MAGGSAEASVIVVVTHEARVEAASALGLR
jgi:hypothetical protein